MKNKYFAVVVAGLLIAGCSDSDAPGHEAFDQATPEKTAVESDGGVYQVPPREDFMEVTGCLVSPASYEKFRRAAEAVGSDSADMSVAASEMTSFLADLFMSRPNAEGFVDERCLHPTVRGVAGKLGLFDDEGRFHADL